MTDVYIYGRMGEMMGSHHKFACNHLDELLKAIESNTGKLRRYISDNRKRCLAIFVDNKNISIDDLRSGYVNVKNKIVKIVPLLVGAGLFTFFVGVFGATMVGKVAAFVATAVVMTAISVGLTLLMQQLFKPDKPDSASSTSYAFTSAENVTRQGSPVPVGYGRFKVGSVVLSTCIKNIEKTYAKGSTFSATLRSALNRQNAISSTRAETTITNISTS